MNPKNEKIFSGVDIAQQEITAKTRQELVEKVTTEPGAPFEPDMLKFLTKLKKEDRATFETLVRS